MNTHSVSFLRRKPNFIFNHMSLVMCLACISHAEQITYSRIIRKGYELYCAHTLDEIRAQAAWRLRAARAYAEIALRVEDDFEDVIRTIDDPHDAWVMLEQSYGSQQSSIQSVINSESTLARWGDQTPHRDHMKTLRTRLSAASLTLPPIRFY